MASSRAQQLMALADEGDENAKADLWREFGIKYGMDDEEDPTIPITPSGNKAGGKIKAYKKGGKVRGAGIAKRGVKKCKYR